MANPTWEMRSTVDELALAELMKKGITRAEALNLPSFSGCAEFISAAVAMLPIKLYERENGCVKEITGDRRVFLLNSDTGDLMDGFQFKKALALDYLLDGNGYVYINRRLGRNEVESLHYVPCRQVSANVGVDPIFKHCDFLVNGATYRDFDFIKILRNTKNGATGSGIISENEKALSVAYYSLKYEEKLVKAGGCRKGFLLSKNKLLDTVMEDLKAKWKKLFSTSDENVIVLNNGITFQEATNTSVELQLNENKRTNSDEICKLFPLSPKLLGGEASDTEYTTSIKLAVTPVLAAFAGALNRDLLLENEKESRYFAFDTRELMKGDTLKRYQAYKMALDGKFLQIDEVRTLEDRAPLGVDFITLGLDDVLYNPKTKSIYTPNTNMETNMGNRQGGEKKLEN